VRYDSRGRQARVPELPDITVYVEGLRRKLVGSTVDRLRLGNPFFLRTVTPSWTEVAGKRVVGVERLGKRIAIELDDDLHLVIHLMKLGRLQWDERGKSPGAKVLHATFVVGGAALHVIEIGPKKRASLHLLRPRAARDAMRPAGIEPLACTPEDLARALRCESHTLKRSLTDQRLVSGIGNAYSDEILHAARMSPVLLSTKLDDAAVRRLWEAMRATLETWTERLRAEVGDGFPGKVTAFRSEMAVHGRYKLPCPVCATPVERIVYADRETNYCARCQTGGKRLADRALSRLLGDDWPKTLEELEERRA
jgi:formamidopyrimidine-DNA glycosylase